MFRSGLNLRTSVSSTAIDRRHAGVDASAGSENVTDAEINPLFTCTHSRDAAWTSVHFRIPSLARGAVGAVSPASAAASPDAPAPASGASTTQKSECTKLGWFRYSTKSAPYCNPERGSHPWFRKCACAAYFAMKPPPGILPSAGTLGAEPRERAPQLRPREPHQPGPASPAAIRALPAGARRRARDGLPGRRAALDAVHGEAVHLVRHVERLLGRQAHHHGACLGVGAGAGAGAERVGEHGHARRRLRLRPAAEAHALEEVRELARAREPHRVATQHAV